MSYSLPQLLDFEVPDTCTFSNNLVIEDPKNDAESAAVSLEDDWTKVDQWAILMPDSSFQINQHVCYAPEMTNMPNVNSQMLRSTYIPTENKNHFSTTRFENFKSALAGRTSSTSSSFQHSSAVHPKRRNTDKFIQKDEPDTSGIDINAALQNLGISQEMFGTSEVCKLFFMFKKLSFYINSNYIFENICDERKFPRTLSVSVQIKYALWSCKSLLYQLRRELNTYRHAWSEYMQPFTDCQQALEKLNASIIDLDQFKSCILEHRGGVFVTPGAHGQVSQLTRTLEEVIESVGQCRLNIQGIAWASMKFQRKGVSYAFPVNEYKISTESTEVNRTVRRNIGSD